MVIEGSSGNNVGGTGPGEGNVISGNVGSGVTIQGAGAEDNFVLGNLIGTDATGKFAIGNSSDGVTITTAADNIIGGAGAGRNLISGNLASGVQIAGASASGNVVVGNRIGTDVDGASAVANANGVNLNNSFSNLVSGNMISGNTSAGVLIQGANATSDMGNVIAGNLIGTDATGLLVVSPASPQPSGILIDDAPGNVVGGTSASARNVLSGNVVGVDVTGSNSSETSWKATPSAPTRPALSPFQTRRALTSMGRNLTRLAGPPPGRPT